MHRYICLGQKKMVVSKDGKQRNDALLGVGTVFLLILFLYLFRLGTDGFYNRDEERIALSAYEMLQNGNWLIPPIRGNPLVTKPILFYWLVLISSALLGKVSEFALKLPSALAGLAGLLVIFCNRSPI